MNNKLIIDELKNQAQFLIDDRHWDGDDLKDWVDKTKIYILGLWLDKRDENFKKEVIRMLEKYRDKIPTCNLDMYVDIEKAAENLAKEMVGIEYKLRNVLQSFIEVLELREKAKSKENDTPEEWKKSKTNKKKSD